MDEIEKMLNNIQNLRIEYDKNDHNKDWQDDLRSKKIREPLSNKIIKKYEERMNLLKKFIPMTEKNQLNESINPENPENDNLKDAESENLKDVESDSKDEETLNLESAKSKVNKLDNEYEFNNNEIDEKEMIKDVMKNIPSIEKGAKYTEEKLQCDSKLIDEINDLMDSNIHLSKNSSDVISNLLNTPKFSLLSYWPIIITIIVMFFTLLIILMIVPKPKY